MEYSWSVLPAKENLLKSLLAIAVIAFIAALVSLAFESIAWAGFSVIVLVVSLQRYFFTSYFKIDDKGVNAAYLIGKKFLPWKRIKSFKAGTTNAYLSPMDRISKWTLHRGLFLVYSESDKEKISRMIEEGISENEPV